jgi:hypothetical protein
MLLFFFGFVWWHWRDQNLRIQELENKQPTINVKPRIEGKFARLDLETDKTALFSVKVTRWEGIELLLPTPPMVFPYFAKWFNTHDIKSLELISGDNHSIDLIEFDGQVLNEKYPEDKSIQKVLIPSDWVIREGRIKANRNIMFTFVVNSEPKQKSAFKRAYVLTINEKGEWTQFKETQNDTAKS